MTSEDLKSCNFTNDYFKFRKVLSSRSDPARHLLCGSFFEIPLLYFLLNPTDIDVMFCDMTLCANFNHVIVPERYRRNVLTIDTTDCHVGFVRLKSDEEYIGNPYQYDNGPAVTSQVPIKDNCVREGLGEIYKRWRDIYMLTKDSVYTLSCPLWPPDAHEWITRKRLHGWPSEETIDAIVKSGCHLVSKPHAKNPNDDTQWRYSFSQAETILIHNSWTDVQKYIYHLLRIIKRDVVIKCGGENKTFLSNYYFKTLMLWACEEKPSEFWEDRNIVTSVREMILDFIEKLIERNSPHYFMPTNNLMDDLPCNSDVGIVIGLLLNYGEDEILEIIRKEPKAYEMNPGFIVIPNHSLLPLAAKLSYILYLSRNKVDDRQLEESRIFNICSSNCFYPELEYLHNGIMMHLQLLKFNKYETGKSRQDVITSAEELFDQSIKKLDFGFTRIRLHLGWSIFELYQQLWLLCGGKHVQNQDLALYCGSSGSRYSSTACYVRDDADFMKNHCSFSPNRMETSSFPILQEAMLNSITLPFNSTYFVCSAYRANFFYNYLCNYKKALDLCEEAKEQLNGFTPVQRHLFDECLPFPLTHEWCGLYDKYIQIILDFLTLHRTIATSITAGKRRIPFHICSVQYLRYIYTRCCRILNEPVTVFGFNYERLYRNRISILRFQVHFSDAVLRTALYISEPEFVH